MAEPNLPRLPQPWNWSLTEIMVNLCPPCCPHGQASKSVEELVPALYHQYLGMFQKSASQGLPPLLWYNFRVEPPGAVPQASPIIPLSPAVERKNAT
ncbi:uncharacterized protein VP01_8238g1, partial [Puccinia sorghi]